MSELRMIEPTAEERRNGWDAESLSRYVAERRSQQQRIMNPHTRKRPAPTRAASGGYRFGPYAGGRNPAWTRAPSWRR